MKRVEDIKPTEQDLPWANEYLDSVGVAGDVTRVKKIIPGQKGFTIIGSTFKGFLFQGSQLHDFLSDALSFWQTIKILPFGLYIEVLDSGKITLCTEEEETCIPVFTKKSKTVEIKWQKESESGSQEKPLSNPFIPQSPSPTLECPAPSDKSNRTKPSMKL